jgi:hypothetical protein
MKREQVNAGGITTLAKFNREFTTLTFPVFLRAKHCCVKDRRGNIILLAQLKHVQ